MTGRGRRGGGTVFYDKDRKCYVGQVSYIDDAGKRQRPKVFGQTAEEAQDKLDALRAELKTTGSVAPKDLTVRHIMEDLLAHPPSSWKSPLTTRGNRDRAAHIIAGLGKAKLVLYSGRYFPLDDCRSMGLIDVVSEQGALPGAHALAQELCTRAPLSQRGAKVVLEALDRDEVEQRAAEIAALQEAAVNSEDHSEARKAFLEKRTPVFKGH